MELVTSLTELRKQEIVYIGKRRFDFGEQFRFYRGCTKQEQEDYKRTWECLIKQGIVFKE